jgi:hypothetical protein
MAQPLRIQYPGALYYAIARGTQGRPIFRDDQNRQCFLKTLGEACAKTGWEIHAYAVSQIERRPGRRLAQLQRRLLRINGEDRV